MPATSLGVALSGECLRGEGLVWLIGTVVCLLAATAGPIVRVSECDGWPHLCCGIECGKAFAFTFLPLALANQLPFPRL